jgi:hypothetical protein
MTPEWCKQLHKIADVVVTMPTGHHMWPKEMSESWLTDFFFPFLRHETWQLQNTSKMYTLEQKLHGL